MKTGRTVGHTGIARILQPTGCLPEKPHFNQRSGKWWEHVTRKMVHNHNKCLAGMRGKKDTNEKQRSIE